MYNDMYQWWVNESNCHNYEKDICLSNRTNCQHYKQDMCFGNNSIHRVRYCYPYLYLFHCCSIKSKSKILNSEEIMFYLAISRKFIEIQYE